MRVGWMDGWMEGWDDVLTYLVVVLIISEWYKPTHQRMKSNRIRAF